MAQAQLELQRQLIQPSMIPISSSAHRNGGRYCKFKGCFEAKNTYNILRDHIFTHRAFRAKMIELDVDYAGCCEQQPTFINKKHRWLHRFKYCKSAPENLKHILSKVWYTLEEDIHDDGVSTERESLL